MYTVAVADRNASGLGAAEGNTGEDSSAWGFARDRMVLLIGECDKDLANVFGYLYGLGMERRRRRRNGAGDELVTSWYIVDWWFLIELDPSPLPFSFRSNRV